MKKTSFLLLLFVLSVLSSLRATTLVYNMKVRRTFEVSGVKRSRKYHWLASVLPITYNRDARIIDDAPVVVDVQQDTHLHGAVLNLRYTSDYNWWAEATTGVAKQESRVLGTANFCAERTGMDDLVFSAGYNMYPIRNMQFVLYGIGGVPLKSDVTSLESLDTLVGTRFKSLGAGAEVSFAPIHGKEFSWVWVAQYRFLHFFSRSWFPILPRTARIQPGNTMDLVLAMQFRILFNLFEVGYNRTRFSNQAVILESGTLEDKPFYRNGAYFNLVKLFRNPPFICRPLAVGVGGALQHLERFESTAFIGWFNLSLAF